MSFNITFAGNEEFTATFQANQNLAAQFGEIIEIPVGDFYTGEYTVTPHAYEAQVLPTQNKAMLRDVTVLEIPYVAVSNPVGGKTVTIGGI